MLESSNGSELQSLRQEVLTLRKENEALNEEVRILRRIFAQKNTKKKQPEIRISVKRKGIQNAGVIKLQLVEMPEPRSCLIEDLKDYWQLAQKLAEERREEMGYKTVSNIEYTGKAWIATFEVE